MANKLEHGWLDLLKEAGTAPWSTIPEIGLYMDQVISYLNRRLTFLTEEDPLLTSSMVNNYVKAGVLSRPVQRRYDREQLADLYMLCSVKQVLSLLDASDMMAELKKTGGDTEERYRQFTDYQTEACAAAAEEIEAEGTTREARLDLALKFALQASVCRAAAVQLIDSIRTPDAAARKARKKAARDASKKIRAAKKTAKVKKSAKSE
jgi:hypothetical protein